MDADILFLMENSYLKWEMIKSSGRTSVTHIVNDTNYSLFCNDTKNNKKIRNRKRKRNDELNTLLYTLYDNMREHPETFFEHTSMSVNCFDYILDAIRIDLEEKDTHAHHNISPEERLFVTLRHISSGMAMQALSRNFGYSPSLVSRIVYNTCEAIKKKLSNVHMPQPTKELLMKVSSDFEILCNFPNCIGSLNDRHCEVKHRKLSGLFKFRKIRSIVLQAVADAKNRFIFCEVVHNQNNSDELASFYESKLKRLLENGAFNVPKHRTLPNSDIKVPYVLVADEKFPLKEYMLRPYTARMLNEEREYYNNRLSRANKVAKDAFAILYKKWQVFTKPIETNVKHAELIIETACILHNVVIDVDGYSNEDLSEYTAQLFKKKRRMPSCKQYSNTTNRAKEARKRFTKYLWEHDRIILNC